MKRFFITLVMGTFLLALIFTGALTGQESVAAEFTAKYPHVLLPDTPAGRAAERFAKLINERTNGRVEIKVFPNGQLGTNTQIIEQLQMNIVQIAMPPTAILGQFEPRMQLIDLPYIFPTREACYAVLDGEAGKTLLTGLSNVGINGLGFWESGFKQFTTQKNQSITPVISRVSRLEQWTARSSFHSTVPGEQILSPFLMLKHIMLSSRGLQMARKTPWFPLKR